MTMYNYGVDLWQGNEVSKIKEPIV